MTKLEIIINEIEGGFTFNDHIVEINVRKEEEKYYLEFTCLEDKKHADKIILSNVNNINQAYVEWRSHISDYWQHTNGLFFEINNLEKITKMFELIDKKYSK